MRGQGIKRVAGVLALAGSLAVGGAAMSAAQGPGGPGGPAAEGRGWGGHRGPGGPGGFGGGGFLMLRGVDLTDQQREQIRGIVGQHKEEFKAVREKLRAARDAQRTASEATPFDENGIRTAATALGAAEGDLAVLTARVRSEALQVLTPEQQTALQTRKAEMEKRRAEWGQKRQQRQQGAQPPQQ